MNIQGVIGIMKRVHDEEGWNLGTASTRDQRNYFLERVCGIVHWGHAKYNPDADPQWHCKDPDQLGGGRPASDDVVVSMPSRTIYDCIPGCGADGYRFASNPTGEHMPDQTVFAPRKPKLVDGPGGSTQPGPTPTPTPSPCQTLGRDEALDELSFLDSYYRAPEGLQRPDGLSLGGKPDFLGIAAWYLDVYEKERIVNKKSRAEARAEYVKQIRGSNEWGQKHPGETP